MSTEKTIIESVDVMAKCNKGRPLMAVSVNGKRVRMPDVEGWVFECENVTPSTLLGVGKALVNNALLTGEDAVQMMLVLADELNWEVKVSRLSDGNYFCKAGIVGEDPDKMVYIMIQA